MYSRLFEVSDEDTFMLVCKQIGALLNDGQNMSELMDSAGSKFLAECRALQNAEDTPGMLKKFTEHIDLLFEKSTEKDAESSVQIMSHHLPRLLPGESGEPVNALTGALVKNTKQHPEARLKSLVHLYNTAPYPEDKYTILLKAITYATEAGLSDMLVPVIRGKAESFARNWELSERETRQLYMTFAGVLRQSRVLKDSVKESLELMAKALSLVEASDIQGLKETQSRAAEAVADFIRVPGIYTCDLAALPAVQHLAKDKSYTALYKLFSVMVGGELKALEASAKPELLKELGITKEQCLDKMRMAALLTLARSSGRKPIPFGEVQEALGITAEQVEYWIIKAIGEKLLEARIDQQNTSVLIGRCTNKTFNASDWNELSEQLAGWKSMLSNVEGMLSEAKSMQMPRGVVHN